jgi:DNA-directed RNA polymerase specialized sigma24 family protein
MTTIDAELTKRLFTLAYYASGRMDIAEEMTRETLVHILLDRKTAVAFNSCARRLYLEGKRVFERQPDMLGDYSSIGSQSIGSRILAEMDYDERFLLLLRFWYGLPVREASDILNISPSTAQRTMQKAINRMQAIITSYNKRS